MIVETRLQATHFVDLMRHLVGDIDKDTIKAMSVRPDQMKLNDMAPPPEAEHSVSLKTQQCYLMPQAMSEKSYVLL